MRHISILFYSVFLLLLSSCSSTLPPNPYGAIPSPAQLEWQKMEYYMFIHFGPNTFTDVEWGDGKENPKVFNPSDLDCRQWAATAKAAGMKGIIITAKHHDGFCLWPSKYSTHTVRESPWKEGKGDLLRELSDACKEYGLKFGVYLSPWDQNHPDYGTPVYNQTFVNTLDEVLSNYGDVFEQWFDGANGEGHNGKKQIYDWELFNNTVYKKQRDAIIFSDIGPGCRWVGNEEGYMSETNWSRLNVEGFEAGRKSPPLDTLNIGNTHGEKWVPAEANTSIRPGWFFSPSTNDKVKSLEKLLDIYYASAGRNANLLLNVPPDRRGRIHPNDSTRLMEFRNALDKSFETNLAKGAVSASSVRGDSKSYSPDNILDGNYDSYWTTDDDITTASIELQFASSRTFNRILLQEYIPLGQRIARFNIEYWDDDTNSWKFLSDGTTIGYKRILCFPSITTSGIKINITNSFACPIINNLEIYNALNFSSGLKESIDIHGGISTAKWSVFSPALENVGRIIDGKDDDPISLAIQYPVIVDLGERVEFKGFFYIPQNSVGAANVSRYNFYVSDDNKSWIKLKSNSLFNNLRNNPIRQDVFFDKETKARFIKFEALELTNDGDKYNIVELGIIKP
ncbi:alpha-L-fucosidase [Dysgonomonas sp. BGC7]|uniref:alpha-L-fucosidase n=1 Tax=Dysgonomonas sp. BGC7 TaxID=1658008 RepID=UPI0006818534|nr:alpha-L-fucosidase [Dysgonomonas sp. BGC7]MBD8389314.1 alpha-L-fucosidase [Dysgonomonas sp. BGC7]